MELLLIVISQIHRWNSMAIMRNPIDLLLPEIKIKYLVFQFFD